ncbi:hypothetical protein HID58_051671 [Brassica napus]|uniref:FKB95-like N-terminal Kelch domain-containing protein n=1 Tax=Brassica napus TaxID=3708 RepID=A0ABQ8A9L5_BRANA|nr:hypothetical protein HID58_051671 [Brassica napus]
MHEHCLYVFLVNEDEPDFRRHLYILCPKANGEHRLVLIRSLPDMPTYISQTAMGYVAMGSRVYVFSRSNKHHMITLSIDCGSHTVQPLPDVPVPMSPRMADIIKGRIYVIGYDNGWEREGGLRAYDQKQRRWRVVNGLEALLPETTSSTWPHVVSYGGKLVLFYPKRNEIWCEEISLETRQGGEIWGRVEWRKRLVTGNFVFMKALDVVV